MSINVTVNGNPIKIHKGKMVATDSMSDFNTRRKIRLQQVRQQSKELAATIRNKAKKQKNKSQSEFEKKNQRRIEEWQNRKLLELQQYDEQAAEIGQAYRQAEIDEVQELEQMEREQIINESRAQHRGKIAHEILQVEKNRVNTQKAISVQRKKLAREVENVRASVIANQQKQLPKTTKTKRSFKVAGDQNNTIPDTNDIDTPDDANNRQPPSRTCSPDLRTPCHNLPGMELSKEHNLEHLQTSLNRTTEAISTSPKKTYIESSTRSMTRIELEPDTRISDRIRNRHFHRSPPRKEVIPESSTSTSECIPQVNQNNKENQYIRTKVLSKSTNFGVCIAPSNELNADQHVCVVCTKHIDPYTLTHSCNPVPAAPSPTPCSSAHVQCPQMQRTCTEIPPKPTVSLLSNKLSTQYSQCSSGQYRKVRCYNHNNRFAHDYVADASQAQRIEPDDLVYGDDNEGPSKSPNKNDEFSKCADERARMASIRGKKALDKKKIQKDYEDLMKKLPLLQKKERIAKLNPAKDHLHMSEERKNQHEKNRQQELERAFERAAPTMITLSPRKPNKQSKRSEDDPKKKMTGAKAAAPKGQWQSAVTQTKLTSPSGVTKAQLQELLTKLKQQKEELLKECKDLPEDSNFYHLIDELEFVSHKQKTNNKDQLVQTDSAVSVRKSSKSSCGTTTQPHRQVLILQNISTQTSPKPSVPPSSSDEGSTVGPSKTQSKSTSAHKTSGKDVCDCTSRDRLCEILIKFRNAKGEVVKEVYPEVQLRDANRMEEALNLETRPARSKTYNTNRPKRSRSESPKKTPVKRTKSPPPNRRNAERIAQGSSKPPCTWRNCLAANSKQRPDDVTSSTSYYSPPDYNAQATIEKKKDVREAANKLVNCGLLGYINKLLLMSKTNLNSIAANVSSASEVPTPSSSIINMSTNRPQRRPPQGRRETETAGNLSDSTYIEKLSTILNQFNLTQQEVNGRSRTRTNSIESVGSSCSNVTEKSRTQYLTLETPTQTRTNTNEPVIDQFSQWAAICQERINNLTAMIDHVRMEKQLILESTRKSDTMERSDNATAYLNLPPRTSSSSSDSLSLEQMQLNQLLLDVHDGPTRQITPKDMTEIRKLLENSNDPDLDRDIVERYLRLIDVELHTQQIQRAAADEKRCKPDEHGRRPCVTFTPMLDIPKLPKFQPQHPSTSASTSDGAKTKKPPITSNALRYNEIIHELSVIPEAENSRLSKSPQSRKSDSPQKRVSKPPPATVGSPNSPVTPAPQAIEVSDSSTDKSNMSASVETMLKTIGLEWAIPTLKKMNTTNMNMSSSSSASDLDIRKFNYLLNKNMSTSTDKDCCISQIDLNVSQHQRTSTPVPTANSSKSQKSQRLIKSGESEISPVTGAHAKSKGGKRSAKSPVDTQQQHPEEASYITLSSNSLDDDDDGK